MERIGIYGGTFNPPHAGHVRGAQYACEALGLSKLLVIPSCAHPGKKTPENLPTSRQRMEMLQLAFDGIGQVSDMELQRGGISYTADTVQLLRKEYPQAELILLMGSDTLESFEKWRRCEDILREASLGVFCRGGKNEKAEAEKKKAELERRGGKVYILDNPVVSISSSQLSRLLAFDCAQAFLPGKVGAYIAHHGLYATAEPKRRLPMAQLEQAVIRLLKPNRVAHVLGCRDTAAALAKRWGADETDAARAGLLHDITKALDGPLQLTLCRSYGIKLDAFSVSNPKTLHALTGSLVADRIFGENRAVVNAIRSHTTGKADMNLLEKIIYVADYMEPNRDFPGVEELRALAFSDLDGALRMGLEMTLAMLIEQGREISPESQQALAWLKNQK